MPNEHFHWNLSNSQIAEVDQTGIMKAHKIGNTEIIVHDKKFTLNEAKGSIYIVKPSYLKFKVEQLTKVFNLNYEEKIMSKCRQFVGDDEQNLIEKHDYMVSVETYDQNNNLIHITEVSRKLIF